MNDASSRMMEEIFRLAATGTYSPNVMHEDFDSSPAALPDISVRAVMAHLVPKEVQCLGTKLWHSEPNCQTAARPCRSEGTGVKRDAALVRRLRRIHPQPRVTDG